MRSTTSRQRIALVSVLAAVIGATTQGLGSTQRANAATSSSVGVLAWGSNAEGQLGNGLSTDNAFPGMVKGLAGAKSISGGNWLYSMALLSNGTVMAWGDNGFGQLGNGSTVSSAVPVAVKNLSGVKAVSAGWDHSLALLSNGTVMSWGMNLEGQLGIGTYSGQSSCGVCWETPRMVKGLTNVTAISAGEDLSLALLSNGTVMSWGYNAQGELGNGSSCPTICESATPTPVKNLKNVKAISAGTEEALALLSNGTVVAWGDNALGQLGQGTNIGPTSCGADSCSTAPVTVSSLSGISAIATGEGHNLALLSNGTVAAWGFGLQGQLGNGSTASSYLPAAVTGLTGVKSIAAGGDHSMALLSNGTIMAWGYNPDGELGNGTTSTSGCLCAELPQSVDIPGQDTVAGIAAGWSEGFAIIGSIGLPTSWSTPNLLSNNVDANPGTGGLDTVFCTGQAFCAAGGSYGTYRWTYQNGLWSAPESLIPTGIWSGGELYVQGISCVSSTFCVAVGNWGLTDTLPNAVAWVYNGSRWSSPSYLQQGFLEGVSCRSVTFCMAVGGEYAPPQTSTIPVSEIFNGKAWTTVSPVGAPISGDQSGLDAVGCGSTTTCMAEGWYQSSPGSLVNFAEVWNGQHWTVLPQSPSYSATGYSFPFYPFSSVSCPSASYCLAVGTDSSGTGIAQEYNGSALASMPVPLGSAPSAVSCPHSSNCLVGTLSGAILSLVASSWSTPLPVASEPIRSVSCPLTSFCMAVDGNDFMTFHQ